MESRWFFSCPFSCKEKVEVQNKSFQNSFSAIKNYSQNVSSTMSPCQGCGRRFLYCRCRLCLALACKVCLKYISNMNIEKQKQKQCKYKYKHKYKKTTEIQIQKAMLVQNINTHPLPCSSTQPSAMLGSDWRKYFLRRIPLLAFTT